jgi:hypothetical protein
VLFTPFEVKIFSINIDIGKRGALEEVAITNYYYYSIRILVLFITYSRLLLLTTTTSNYMY